MTVVGAGWVFLLNGLTFVSTIIALRLVVGSAFLFGAATGALALMPTYHSFAVACVPVGLATITMMTAAHATIQTTTPAAMRGRVMAVYMMVFLGSLLIAAGAAFWVVRHWDVQVTYRLRPPFFMFTFPDVAVER